MSIYFKIFIFLISINLHAQVISFGIESDGGQDFSSGYELIKLMHNKFKYKPCKSYSFSQNNILYKNDSVLGKSVWHEYVEFPDKFRIDFNEKAGGDFVIFRNDSSLNYKNFKLIKANQDTNTLLLLLGGMYYRDLGDIYKRLEKASYDLKIISFQKWNKKNYYVIGANLNDSTSNQIWINKSSLQITRIIEKSYNNSIEFYFEKFKKLCNAYTETKVVFKRNGKIEQVEDYYDIKNIDKLPDEIFYPKINR